MRRMILASGLAAALAAMAAAPALAEGTATICMPYAAATGKIAAGKPIVAGSEEGACKNTKKINYKAIKLPEGGLETLNDIAPHLSYEAAGIDAKPTIRFSGVNVQIVNGEGKTEITNGEGNLVIGYDEMIGTPPQTGSHNLVIGTENTYTSYGGLVAGWGNGITAPYASVSGGNYNTATGFAASVTGGFLNNAGGRDGTPNLMASVSGGYGNEAEGAYSAILGGHGVKLNTEFGIYP